MAGMMATAIRSFIALYYRLKRKNRRVRKERREKLFFSALSASSAVFSLPLLGRPRFAGGQRKRQVLSRVVSAADRDDEVLTAVLAFVGHRRSALRRRHPDGAHLLARVLVVGAQHRATRMIRGGCDSRVAKDDERLGDDQPDAALQAGLGDV